MAKRYKYFLDWEGGHLWADSLPALCQFARAKFGYMETIPDGDPPWTKEEVEIYNRIGIQFDAGYLRRNIFGRRKASGYYSHFLNVKALEEYGIPLSGDWFRIGRYPV